MKNLVTRLQIWNYWRKTYANYECFNWIYKIKVLLDEEDLDLDEVLF